MKESTERGNKYKCNALKANSGRRYAGKLSIGYSGVIDEPIIIEILKTMARRHPQVDIRLQRFNLGDLTKCLEHNVLDVIITCEPYFSRLTDIKVEPIQDMFLCALFPDDCPLAQYKSIDCVMLQGTSLLTLERGENPVTHDKILGHFANCGFVPDQIYYFKDPQTMILSAVAEKGVAILLAPKPDFSRYHLKAVKLSFSTQGVIKDTLSAVHREENNNPTIEMLVQTIRAMNQEGTT